MLPNMLCKHLFLFLKQVFNLLNSPPPLPPFAVSFFSAWIAKMYYTSFELVVISKFSRQMMGGKPAISFNWSFKMEWPNLLFCLSECYKWLYSYLLSGPYMRQSIFFLCFFLLRPHWVTLKSEGCKVYELHGFRLANWLAHGEIDDSIQELTPG